ncbi:chromate transporter [Myroides odoratus]|uniref:Chromate transporter, chromate ion transporter (CHR) family n=1 Tax=Myroides odoratus TaxID=256 RepID=A0A378RNX7_MYROD|nr:chromate transporter [Myroides odoratus]QQU05143.1 chromate transporter [Myroides odoratus]STZ27370.1 chromate transporter, chromate ion transporter (CHR) family [Myroides odoratus]
MIFYQLFWVFIKIGTFGFGGGYAMLSLIQEEVVDHHQWISKSEFTNLVAVSQMTPGPIGINTATYVGYAALINEGYPVYIAILGSALTTIALCLPAFLMIGLISYFYFKFRSNKFFAYAISGIKPLGISLIALAALSLTNKESFPDYFSPVLFIGALVCSIRFKVHPVLILFGAAILGILFY